MSFTIITTLSPDYTEAWRQIMPTWFVNSGASEIVVHRIDEGGWVANIIRRNEIMRDEILQRMQGKQRVLFIDADCLILRPLGGGFSDTCPMSLARWPEVNMGVFFVNLTVPFDWENWMQRIIKLVWKDAQKPHKPTHGYDQFVWQPCVNTIPDQVAKLDEDEWNYNNFDVPQWEIDLPRIKDTVRIWHLKGHGAWSKEKLEFLHRAFPRELACVASDLSHGAVPLAIGLRGQQ
jgi:hypothetical protein